jgi:uncharacterized protein (DUF433 family)
MRVSDTARTNVVPLGIGYYTVPEVARLLEMSARTINRWLGGYAYSDHGDRVTMVPLWIPQLPRLHDHLELGFRDLIELRFVRAFVKVGLGLNTIRRCLDYARECVNDERPFSTQRFQTDGRTIFLDTLNQSGANELLDLKRHQYVLGRVIESSFKDLDIDSATVTRWRPFNGKSSIVIDPRRAFGQPIASQSGIPTVTLADAVKAEGSIERVAHLFEVSREIVRDAVNFEKRLLAA